MIENERLPNGSQTITHAAEEDVISNLKHFRGLHLPFAVYWLASHFQELFCLYQHNCNLHPLLCWPVNHCSKLCAPSYCAQSECTTKVPSCRHSALERHFCFPLLRLSLLVSILISDICSLVSRQPNFLLAWQSERYKQYTAFVMINLL